MARVRALPTSADLISRDDAKARGLKKYFTGLPCAHGHIDFRTTSSTQCRSCKSEIAKNAYAADPAPAKRRALEWSKQNPEKRRAQCTLFRETNPASAKAAQRKYRAKIVDKIREDNRAWWQSNPEKVKGYNARRRARRLGQLCSCCTAADFEALYSLAEPWIHEVDHIVPLAAGGKHCTKNLQVLTVEQHKIKTRTDRDVIARYKREMWLDAA